MRKLLLVWNILTPYRVWELLYNCYLIFRLLITTECIVEAHCLNGFHFWDWFIGQHSLWRNKIVRFHANLTATDAISCLFLREQLLWIGHMLHWLRFVVVACCVLTGNLNVFTLCYSIVLWLLWHLRHGRRMPVRIKLSLNNIKIIPLWRSLYAKALLICLYVNAPLVLLCVD